MADPWARTQSIGCARMAAPQTWRLSRTASAERHLYPSRSLPPRCNTASREAKMMLDRRDFLVGRRRCRNCAPRRDTGWRCRSAALDVTNSGAGLLSVSLGQFQITVVSDGTISFPCEALWPEAAKADRDAVLAGDFQPTENATLQVNVLAVNTGDRLVLIDAGSRGKFQPTASRLLQNLAAAEIKPEQVDTVVITHFHPDHLWGVTDDNDAERPSRMPNTSSARRSGTSGRSHSIRWRVTPSGSRSTART